MKVRNWLLAAGLASLFGAPALAMAQYLGPTSSSIDTVAKALKGADDSYAVLEGTLDKRLTSDTYEFRDDTGTVTVEIDPETFPAKQVDAQTKVRLHGEVDRSWDGLEIDVKRMEVL